MLEHEFSLEEYLGGGIRRLVRSAIHSTLKNPKQSLFFVRFAKTSQKAFAIRQGWAQKGEHIPPFLIASISQNCNLHCAGCYARANHACEDQPAADEMDPAAWRKIFAESTALGIQFILLAGGEPLMRPEILRTAADFPQILFPVFTNGTLFTPEIRSLFTSHRHLIPMLSLEGNALATDLRRGKGTHARLMRAMDELRMDGVLYGASITVTRANLGEVTDLSFVEQLSGLGCRVILYVEYVPMDAATVSVALDDAIREGFERRLAELRQKRPELIFISFPGDEKAAGGCLAAGRGFFHINANGSAEPCPFSPYSDRSLKNVTVQEALRSPLFHRIQDQRMLLQEHVGGCVLFEQDALVRKLVENADSPNREKEK